VDDTGLSLGYIQQYVKGLSENMFFNNVSSVPCHQRDVTIVKNLEIKLEGLSREINTRDQDVFHPG